MTIIRKIIKTAYRIACPDCNTVTDHEQVAYQPIALYKCLECGKLHDNGQVDRRIMHDIGLG